MHVDGHEYRDYSRSITRARTLAESRHGSLARLEPWRTVTVVPVTDYRGLVSDGKGWRHAKGNENCNAFYGELSLN